jgi:hypothetical protein
MEFSPLLIGTVSLLGVIAVYFVWGRKLGKNQKSHVKQN